LGIFISLRNTHGKTASVLGAFAFGVAPFLTLCTGANLGFKPAHRLNTLFIDPLMELPRVTETSMWRNISKMVKSLTPRDLRFVASPAAECVITPPFNLGFSNASSVGTMQPEIAPNPMAGPVDADTSAAEGQNSPSRRTATVDASPEAAKTDASTFLSADIEEPGRP